MREKFACNVHARKLGGGGGVPVLKFLQRLAFDFSYICLFFFRTAILWKLFDIRFSYNHSNFSSVCLFIRMSSKTVTRSVRKIITSLNKGVMVQTEPLKF